MAFNVLNSAFSELKLIYLCPEDFIRDIGRFDQRRGNGCDPADPGYIC